ncbi:MAG: hypothetical protein U0V70_21750, partial [Terriglobia bacterium]
TPSSRMTNSPRGRGVSTTVSIGFPRMAVTDRRYRTGKIRRSQAIERVCVAALYERRHCRRDAIVPHDQFAVRARRLHQNLGRFPPLQEGI